MGLDKFQMIHVESEEDAIKRKRLEKLEDDANIEITAQFLLDMVLKREKYTERIALKKDGQVCFEFNNMTELPADAPNIFRNIRRKIEYSKDGLIDIIKRIRKKHPELVFSVKFDPRAEWIEYSVIKLELKVGDPVLWQSNGVAQWTEPKIIKKIEEYQESGEKYAFFEDSLTGIPVDQLTPSN